MSYFSPLVKGGQGGWINVYSNTVASTTLPININNYLKGFSSYNYPSFASGASGNTCVIGIEASGNSVSVGVGSNYIGNFGINYLVFGTV